MRIFLILSSIFVALATNANAKTHRAAISADGKTYAVVRDLENQRIIVFYKVDDPSAKPKAVGLGEQTIGRLAWSGSSFAMVEVTGMEHKVNLTSGIEQMFFSRWVSVDAEDGDIEMLFGNATGDDYNYLVGESGELLASLPGEDDALFSRTSVKRTGARPTRLRDGEDDLVYGLHRVNAKNGRVRRQEWGRTDTEQWVVDENGEVVARVDVNEKKTLAEVYAARGKTLEKIVEFKLGEGDLHKFAVVGRGAEGSDLIVRTQGSINQWEYRKLNLATGALEPGQFSLPPMFGTANEVYDPRRARAHAVFSGSGVYHFNADDRAIQDKLRGSLPGASLLVESASADRTRFIIKAMYGNKPDERYLFDDSAKRLELIARD